MDVVKWFSNTSIINPVICQLLSVSGHFYLARDDFSGCSKSDTIWGISGSNRLMEELGDHVRN